MEGECWLFSHELRTACIPTLSYEEWIIRCKTDSWENDEASKEFNSNRGGARKVKWIPASRGSYRVSPRTSNNQVRTWLKQMNQRFGVLTVKPICGVAGEDCRVYWPLHTLISAERGIMMGVTEFTIRHEWGCTRGRRPGPDGEPPPPPPGDPRRRETYTMKSSGGQSVFVWVIPATCPGKGEVVITVRMCRSKWKHGKGPKGTDSDDAWKLGKARLKNMLAKTPLCHTPCAAYWIVDGEDVPTADMPIPPQPDTGGLNMPSSEEKKAGCRSWTWSLPFKCMLGKPGVADTDDGGATRRRQILPTPPSRPTVMWGGEIHPDKPVDSDYTEIAGLAQAILHPMPR